MEMLNRFVLGLLVFGFALSAVVHSQSDQSDFINLDCGSQNGSNYTDATTGIYYSSDAGYIDSGLNQTISPASRNNLVEQQLSTLRIFPQGTRNCYTLKPVQADNKYLIRATFLYGNYDLKDQLPRFDIYLGVSYWDTVILVDADTPLRKEIIHIPTSDHIYVCLVKTGLATPFISVLELRPLDNSIYQTKYGSLQLFLRINFNPTSTQLIRYPDDIYDRIWSPFTLVNTTTLSTTSVVAANSFQSPSLVMSTASMPEDVNDALSIYLKPDNISDQIFIYMHFAELQPLNANQSREFNIFLNEALYPWYGPIVPNYLSAGTIYSTYPENISPKYTFSINKTTNATLPPIINALEVYIIKEFFSSETDDKDVAAILSIKSTYGLKRIWQGDPCAPQAYVWDGLNCDYNGFEPPRIISLNLSSSRLKGIITPSISNLTKLQILDLSNNNLTGPIPSFLSQLASLKLLNLKGNKLTGPIPSELLKKSKHGSLFLSVDNANGNSDTTCQSGSCIKKNNKVIISVAVSVGAALLVLLVVFITLWMIKRGRQRAPRKIDAETNKTSGPMETKNRQFTYSEVLSFTNNFETAIGQGGFGTVYHGYIGDTQVAVKMLSPSSAQGYKEFQAEANMLMSIHHKNLTSLVGYCDEGTEMGIIYEYMANGSLKRHLSERTNVLNWEERLQIALDAAQGLEYLHHVCKPPIIHRDVKSSNILLDEKFQAKLADFGLSRALLTESDTHVSTIVVGTPGYLDPEYYSTNRLKDKSDVYSFGVVLLEIITGRPALGRSQDKTHVIKWVNSVLDNGGDVRNIVDRRLKGNFDVYSVRKALKLAMVCVSRHSDKRPTMNYVVTELKECLSMEMSQSETESIGIIAPMSLESRFGPQAR